MAHTSSDLKRAFSEDGARKTHIGGQALIEGVMMRGKQSWAVAVREPWGTIYTEERSLSRKGRRSAWLSWPLVRGCVALVDSLVLGYKTLEIAANHAYADLDETNDERDESRAISSDRLTPGNEPDVTPHLQDVSNEAQVANSPSREGDDTRAARTTSTTAADTFGKGEMALSLVMGCALGIALFIFLPALVANLVIGEYETAPLAWNGADGIMRVVIFVFYVWLIGRISDIKRMFMYHGAEHKTIHCYEHGLPLTPENAQQFPRLHVRCGTAFLIMVMIIAILVYTIIPLDAFLKWAGITNGALTFALLILIRIALLPLIAGISYEITVKWAGSHPENPLVRVVLWPGMQMQYLTTNEPDEGQLECAIAAMQMVLEWEEVHKEAKES